MSIIIDSDSHFMPSDAFEDPEAQSRFGSRWPRFRMDALGRDWIVFRERYEQLNAHQRSLPCSLVPGKHDAGYYDSGARAEWLDRVGIHIPVQRFDLD